MDTTRQPIVANPAASADLTPPAAAASDSLPEEVTGDSESDVAASVENAGRSSGADEDDDDDDDDAESCYGGGGGNGVCFIDSAEDESDDDEFDDDVAAMEVDLTEVDSKMSLPWWRRTGEYAARDGGGGYCAPSVAAAEGAINAAESNRMFWEACIAHGY